MKPIPSTYVLKNSTGYGPVRTIEKGSPEWKAIVADLELQDQPSCKRCKQPFEVLRTAGRPQVFCSPSCRIKWWKSEEARRRRADAKHTLCALPSCSRTFDRGNKSAQKYCSPSCAKEARKLKRTASSPDYPPKTCSICGDLFHVRPQNYHRALVCSSHSCKLARRRTRP